MKDITIWKIEKIKDAIKTYLEANNLLEGINIYYNDKCDNGISVIEIPQDTFCNPCSPGEIKIIFGEKLFNGIYLGDRKVESDFINILNYYDWHFHLKSDWGLVCHASYLEITPKNRIENFRNKL